jgi:hypothetical protein
LRYTRRLRGGRFALGMAHYQHGNGENSGYRSGAGKLDPAYRQPQAPETPIFGLFRKHEPFAAQALMYALGQICGRGLLRHQPQGGFRFAQGSRGRFCVISELFFKLVHRSILPLPVRA